VGRTRVLVLAVRDSPSGPPTVTTLVVAACRRASVVALAVERLAWENRPAAAQWPDGGMFDVLSVCLILFILFAARFSFSVLPCFFALAFCGDLSDMMTLHERTSR
jgi:hypothetical protein